MVAGVLLFAGGAALAGLSPTMALLILGRALQGLGGGAAIVAVYVLIARAYDQAVRPRAFSVLAAAWVLPGIIGPFVAGWLADQVSWRAVFLLVPLFVLPPALLLRGPLRRHSGGDPEAGGRPGRTRTALLAAAGLALLQDGLLRLGWVGTVEAAAGLVVLVPAVRRLLPVGTLRAARGLPTTILLRGVLAGAFFAAETFIPLGLIEQRGLSTTGAGLILTVASLGWASGSFLQGRAPGDEDRSRLVRWGCAVITVAVLALPLVLLPGMPAWFAAVSWGVGALGMGMSFPSLSVQTLRLSPAGPGGQLFRPAAVRLGRLRGRRRHRRCRPRGRRRGGRCHRGHVRHDLDPRRWAGRDLRGAGRPDAPLTPDPPSRTAVGLPGRAPDAGRGRRPGERMSSAPVRHPMEEPP